MQATGSHLGVPDTELRTQLFAEFTHLGLVSFRIGVERENRDFRAEMKLVWA